MYAGAATPFRPDLTDSSKSHSQEQLADGRKLFGPHAKLKLQNSPPKLEHENALMQQLGDRLGPYASRSALLYHLRAARGKLNWAVNTYFRAVLADQALEADFWPKHYIHKSNALPESASGTDATPISGPSAEAIVAPQLPAAILEQILQHTNLMTVCNAAIACKTLHMAASSDLLWQQLYHRRWGKHPMHEYGADICIAQNQGTRAAPEQQKHADLTIGRQTDSKLTESESRSSWLSMYQKRHLAETRMQCPSCMQAKVVPVVYGFPSHLLTMAMRAEMLRMGNDHLIENQPIWTCLHCSVELSMFPFWSHGL